MATTQLWTQAVKDDLSESLTGEDTFLPEEQAAIAGAIERASLDTLLVMSDEESARLETEDVPFGERSDAALIFLLADLVYGPSRWFGSNEFESELGDWAVAAPPGSWQPPDKDEASTE